MSRHILLETLVHGTQHYGKTWFIEQLNTIKTLIVVSRIMDYGKYNNSLTQHDCNSIIFK